MKLHPEGRRIILIITLLLALAAVILVRFLPPLWFTLILSPVLLIYILVVRFFRSPQRPLQSLENGVFSPADGRIVAIEEVLEDEYFHEPRLQISVFMSIYNVHINWYPMKGRVLYYKYHPGKFLVAWHPKSSTKNERTTVVIGADDRSAILLRQIAGAVARRIVCYARLQSEVSQNQQMGFIKFGSRVDVFLPLSADIKVVLNQQVTGGQTLLATIPE